MSEFRRQTWVFVLLALLALFAGCKGESSPTAPPVTGPGSNPPDTGTTPVTGAVVTLTVSNATPVVGSTSIITATVTVNGQPAPNGTGVEFSSDIGSFCLAVSGCSEPTTNPIRAALRTTTNGVSTIVLTSSSAATATVQAVVNNVSKTTTVRFVTTPPEPPTVDLAPAITAVAPTSGRPAGGETITISGRNFTAPVRVLFTTDTGVIKEGQVISVTSNEIKVLSPGFDVGVSQQTKVTITVINAAGSTGESRVTSAAATFTYQSTVLTPKVTTASPTSGPINGGTRVTLFGEGFQAPVQVFFGAAEAQVISTTFNQIIVLSPAGSTTADGGSGAVTGFVSVRVVNINSQTTVTSADLFRYTPKMQVTLVGPTEGPFTGGTEITLDGVGFDDPLTVVVAGVAARLIRVSGSQLLAVTNGVVPTGCADIVGPIVVTNGENGDSASGPAFTYRVPKASIVSTIASGGGPIVPGSSVLVTVANAFGFPQFRFGPLSATVTGQVDNGNGTTTFTVTVPQGIELATQPCGPTTSLKPTAFDVVYTSALTTCTATQTGGLFVNPPQVGNLFLTPNPLTLTATAGIPASAGPPPVAAVPARNGNGSFTLVNNGAVPLTITSITNGVCPGYVVTGQVPQTLAPCDIAVVAVQYQPGGAPSCIVTITATSAGQTITKNGTVIGVTQ